MSHYAYQSGRKCWSVSVINKQKYDTFVLTFCDTLSSITTNMLSHRATAILYVTWHHIGTCRRSLLGGDVCMYVCVCVCVIEFGFCTKCLLMVTLGNCSAP